MLRINDEDGECVQVWQTHQRMSSVRHVDVGTATLAMLSGCFVFVSLFLGLLHIFASGSTASALALIVCASFVLLLLLLSLVMHERLMLEVDVVIQLV